MDSVTCPSCGRVLYASKAQKSVACTGCGEILDLLGRRRRAATRSLLDHLHEGGDLPPKLRAELIGRVETELHALLDEAVEEAPSRPEPSTPVPSGARPPPLPTPPTDRAPEPAPIPASDRRRERRRAEKEAKREAGERARAARTEPTVWSRLGPAFGENLGFGLATFLIVAGAVYFTTTAWTTMTGEQRLLVVVGGLVLLGFFLWGAGKLLNRGGTLPEVERVLLLVVAFLLPLAAVPAGDLLWLSFGLGLVGVLLVLPPGYGAGRSLARVLEPRLAPFLPVALTVFAALVLFGRLAGSAPVFAAAVSALLLFAAVTIYGRRVVGPAETVSVAWLWPPILIGFAVLVFVGRASLAAGVQGQATRGILAALGITLSAFGAALLPLEQSLFRKGAFGKRHSIVLLASAIALGISGTVVALGHPIGLLLAAALGAFAAIGAGFRLPVPWLAVPGLVLAALAYLKSPAPFREAVLALRDQAAESLGYAPKKLPLAYYGLTFIPYVALCGLYGWWLLRRDQLERARVMLTWALLSAAGLTLLALFTSGDPPFSDLRAPAAVLGAQGALVLTLGVATRRRWIAFAGLLGLYVGATLGLVHLRAALPLVMLVLGTAGLLGTAVAARLASSKRAWAVPLRAALLDAAVTVTILVAFFGLRDVVAPRTAAWWHPFGYLALAALATVIAGAYRRAEPILLTGAAFAFAVVRLLAVVLPPTAGDGLPLALGLASGAVLLLRSLLPRLPSALRHPYFDGAEDPSLLVPGAVLVVQAVGWLLLLAAPEPPAPTWLMATGLVVGSAVLAVTAFLCRQRWPAVVALFEWLAAGLVVAGALGHAAGGSPGLLAVSIALTAAYVPLFVQIRRNRRPPVATPLFEVLFVLTVPVLIWAGLLLLGRQARLPIEVDGYALAVGCLLLTGLVRVAYDAAPRRGLRDFGGVVAGMLFLPAAYALLARWGASVDVYALGFLATAIVTVAWAGRVRLLRRPAAVHASLSFVLAIVAAVLGIGNPWVLLVTFALLAGCGRLLIAAAPTTGSLLLLLSALAALALVLLRRIVDVDEAYLPAVFLLYTVLARAATRVPALGVTRLAAHIVSVPILAAAGVAALTAAVWIGAWEPYVGDVAVRGGLVAWRIDAAALVITAFAWSVGVARAGRLVLLATAAALASFVVAPVNVLLHGSYLRLWRPDVEIGLVAFLLALALPRVDGALRWKQRRLGEAVAWPLVFAAVALVLTAAALRHSSTPLTVLAVTCVPLAFLFRDRRPGWARWFSSGLLATALAFVAWLRPREGPLALEPLLLFGATSALMAPVLMALAVAWSRGSQRVWRLRAGREFLEVALLAAGAAFIFVVADVAAFYGEPAGAWAVALTAVALVVPGGAAAYGAMRLKRPALIHVTVLTAVTFYAFLAQRTDHLAFLDGYHLHALTVIGATLLFLAQYHADRLGSALALDGLLLALPAALYYVPVALGAVGDAPRAPSALALASIVCAAAGQRFRAPWLGGAAVALLNLMLYAFWRKHEIVDPSLYGVPPGLTLIGAAMVLKNRITRETRLALLVPGIALLYGSVGLQVVQVGDPLHALLLFAMGLATVALGFWLKKDSWQVLGTSVVVLDVVAYIAAHGFERGFFGAALLVAAGLSVLAVVALAARRRRAREARGAVGRES